MLFLKRNDKKKCPPFVWAASKYSLLNLKKNLMTVYTHLKYNIQKVTRESERERERGGELQ